jgi:hypothetical protein
MISQLEGLVKALRGGASGQDGFVVVLSSSVELAQTLACAQAKGPEQVLLLVLDGEGQGTADWSAYMGGMGGLLPSEAQATDGVYRLEARGDLAFPAWATGEVSRRLLYGLSLPGKKWRKVVCSMGLDHNEGVLTLTSAADAVLFEIPDGSCAQANALSLFRTIMERNAGALLGLGIVPAMDSNTGLLVGKVFLQSVGKRSGAKVRLLAERGRAAALEFSDWLSTNAGKK